jgi:hypothetical protein
MAETSIGQFIHDQTVRHLILSVIRIIGDDHLEVWITLALQRAEEKCDAAPTPRSRAPRSTRRRAETLAARGLG